MKGVSIYPNRNLKKELEKAAKKENRSLNNFIISVLNKHFGGSKK